MRQENVQTEADGEMGSICNSRKIRKFILTKEAHVQFMSDKNQEIFTYVPLPEKRKSCS